MHTTAFLLVPTRRTGTRAENYLERWSRGFSCNAIKLSRIGVQTFRFGRDWLNGVAKSEDLEPNAVTLA